MHRLDSIHNIEIRKHTPMKVILAGAGAFGIKHLDGIRQARTGGDSFGRCLWAIHEGREPNSSVAQVLACYRDLHDLEQ